MNSTRLPGKPMKTIMNMPMIGHVYKRVKLCDNLSEVYVATCDVEIFDYIKSIGGKAVMTSNSHERCSDRCAEAMLKIEKETKSKCDIMVMVQGDEPLVNPKMIQESIKPMLEDKNIYITNLISDIKNIEDFESSNEVKVVLDKNNYALYFSREPIPSRRKGELNVPMKKQVAIIPFSRDFLLEFNKMQPTPLEMIESVDMLRIIENGKKIKMINTNSVVKAVDTPKDLQEVSELMAKDKLYKQYS